MSTAYLRSWLKVFAPITLLSFAAGLQMFGALLFFKLETNIVLILAYMLISFGIYLLNRFTDDEDCINCPEQKLYFQKKASLLVIPIALILVSFILLAALSLLTEWHILLIICGIIYSVSIVPWLKNKKIIFLRLKEIIILKNISVSLLWGITPFAIAASIGTQVQLPIFDLIVVIFAFCLTTLINTTSCDVRDIEGDQLAGVRTIAAILGRNITGIVLLCLSVAGSIFVATISYFNYLHINTILLFYITVFWTLLVSIPVYLKSIKLPKTITEPLIDSQQILCGLVLIFISIH
ncbi:MAG: UbiA family prenyltransferase [Fibrobacterota bacterium]|nr:UbiA family prenyltransferase [Chitinispirillaceae bacterium]